MNKGKKVKDWKRRAQEGKGRKLCKKGRGMKETGWHEEGKGEDEDLRAVNEWTTLAGHTDAAKTIESFKWGLHKKWTRMGDGRHNSQDVTTTLRPLAVSFHLRV